MHPRKSYLYLNLRTDHHIDSPRIAKSEQVSKNRYHNELKLTSSDQVDKALPGWIKDAYEPGYVQILAANGLIEAAILF